MFICIFVFFSFLVPSPPSRVVSSVLYFGGFQVTNVLSRRPPHLPPSAYLTLLHLFGSLHPVHIYSQCHLFSSTQQPLPILSPPHSSHPAHCCLHPDHQSSCLPSYSFILSTPHPSGPPCYPCRTFTLVPTLLATRSINVFTPSISFLCS